MSEKIVESTKGYIINDKGEKNLAPGYVEIECETGEKFPVLREDCNWAQKLIWMLDVPGCEESCTEVKLHFGSEVVQTIIRYMEYRTEYKDTDDVTPEFQMDPAIAFHVATAAHYLNL